MGRVRVTNETDEPIIIKPGETADLRGDEDIMRVMSARVNTLDVSSFKDKSGQRD